MDIEIANLPVGGPRWQRQQLSEYKFRAASDCQTVCPSAVKIEIFMFS